MMKYFFIFIFILIGLYFGYFYMVRNRWRKVSYEVARIYLREIDKKQSPQGAFVVALDYRYDVVKQDVPKSSYHVNKLYSRFSIIMMKKMFMEDIPKIDSRDVVQMLGPVQDIVSSNSPYKFEDNRYDLTELIYCVLVIEFPWVASGEKSQTLMIIDQFLSTTKLSR